MHERTLTPFWFHHLRVALVAMTIIAAARMIGEFGPGVSVSQIILHAFIIVLITYPLQTGFAYLCMTHLPDRLPLWTRALAGCLLAAPFTAVLGPLLGWFVGVGHPAISSAASRADLWLVMSRGYGTILAVHMVLGPVLWMSLTYTWWRDWFTRQEQPAPAPAVADDPPERLRLVAENSEPLFMTKLPFNKRGELYALSAELHYVRVYTSAGSDLVLMRISDAVAQCGDVEGLRIHRSHWVALSAVSEVTCDGGSMTVRLRNDLELPVSRSYQGFVRNALPTKVA